jgi:hypothetical protein
MLLLCEVFGCKGVVFHADQRVGTVGGGRVWSVWCSRVTIAEWMGMHVCQVEIFVVRSLGVE